METREGMLRRRRAAYSKKLSRCLRLYSMRIAVWILGAWLVHHAVPHENTLALYIISTVLTAIFLNLRRDEDGDDGKTDASMNDRVTDDAAVASAGVASSNSSGTAARSGEGKRGLHRRQPTSTRSDQEPSHGVTRPLLHGSLAAPQQLALMRAMRAVGTPGAMRCVLDTEFRMKMLSCGDADPRDPCLCGSAEEFGRCCRSVPAELRAVLEV